MTTFFKIEEFYKTTVKAEYFIFKLRGGASRTSHVGRSVGRSVGPSVGRSVRRSVGPWKILTFFDIKVS